MASLLHFEDEQYTLKCHSAAPLVPSHTYKALNDLGEVIIRCSKQQAPRYYCKGEDPEKCTKQLCKSCYLGDEQSKYCINCWFLKEWDNRNSLSGNNPSASNSIVDNPSTSSSVPNNSSSTKKNSGGVTLRDISVDEDDRIRAKQLLRDADDISEERFIALNDEVRDLWSESELIIKRKAQDGNKLALKQLWQLHLCGGARVFGTQKCLSITWWVMHAQILKWEDEGDSPAEITTKTNNLILKYCFCTRNHKYSGNMSLLAEFLPLVELIKPFEKGQQVVVEGKIETETMAKKWERINKEKFEKDKDTMLMYYSPINYINLKGHIEEVLVYFQRVYTNPEICNHRWGYSSDPAMIATLIKIIKTQNPAGDKFTAKKEVDTDINNYFNVSEIHPDLLQCPYDKSKLRACMKVYPEYFKYKVPEDADGSNSLAVAALKEIYQNNKLHSLGKVGRRVENVEKRGTVGSSEHNNASKKSRKIQAESPGSYFNGSGNGTLVTASSIQNAPMFSASSCFEDLFLLTEIEKLDKKVNSYVANNDTANPFYLTYKEALAIKLEMYQHNINLIQNRLKKNKETETKL